ncbi:MAG: efflux RND transporter periplasmic adaptor subunit [Chitinophagia bacterium]|nr:efflux RND transporter periplasmic adaptor subunit [Chitinophagia bacterium]
MKSRTIWWIIIVAVVLLVVVIAVTRNNGNDATKVAVDKVARHTITETVAANGKIYPETEVKISPEVSGEITLLSVQEGDSVHKGDLLVKINPVVYNSMVSQAQASVEQTRASASNSVQLMAQAQSQYELAKSTYERNKKLYDQKVISSLEFEQSQANYLSAQASLDAAKASSSGSKYGIVGAQANLDQARANLQKTTVIAPVDGIISQLNVKLGERVVGTAQYTGTEMLTIADMSRIEVRADVSETDIPKVKINDTAFIETDAYRGRKFVGLVTRISVSAKNAAAVSTDQVTNYVVHILLLPSSYADLAAKLPRGKFPFKPGMSSSVEIQTNRQDNILSVPVNAVTTREWPDSLKNKAAAHSEDGIRQVVFVFDEKTGTVAIRDVKTGLQDNTYLEITSGLREGEQVVVAPYGAIARTLFDKAKVKKVQKDELFEKDSKE